jgi:hypothetical protein
MERSFPNSGRGCAHRNQVSDHLAQQDSLALSAWFTGHTMVTLDLSPRTSLPVFGHLDLSSLSIPSKDDPMDDKTGEKCAINQVDEHVWFLSGLGSGRHEAVCNVPLRKAILMPVVTGICDYFHDTEVFYVASDQDSRT